MEVKMLSKSYQPQVRLSLPQAMFPAELRLGSAKKFFDRHFEKIIVFFVIAATILTHFVVLNKLQFLDIFYLPILLASYILGRRYGIGAAIFSVLTVTYFVLTSPDTYLAGDTYLSLICNLMLWGCFLILTSVVVSTLHEHNVEKTNELREAYEGVLEILSKFIDAADKYTKGHSLRVAELATRLAIKMNLSEKQVETIWVAALLHDIGKIDVSTDVILKAAKLSDEEIKELKSHVEKGGIILKPFRQLFKDAVALILAHHRYYDGTGYGEECANLGEELSQGVGILTLVDAYDAMIADRPYRTGRTPMEALAEIKKSAGKQFDPALVKVFMELMNDKLEAS
jgi:putative nucleotidyltransferase with HDIG domain